MRFAQRHLIRMAAMLALGAASTSAFAQSAEYRRGYEDGYSAGLRAAREDRGPSRGWGGIRIDRADYGARGVACDARRAVRQEFERSDGTIAVGNHLCGDPLPGVRKRLDVLYRCGDGEQHRAGARENEVLRLSCRR